MTDGTTIDGATVLARSDEQVSIRWRGERLLMHIPSCRYHVLNAIGEHIWEHLEQPTTLEELVDRLLLDFEVPREECESGVLGFVRDLAARGFVAIGAPPKG